MTSRASEPRARQVYEQEQEPWYKQFWPWFLIALPGSVVVAGISMVFIANQHADDLVVKDYYKDGLAINQEIERKARAASFGMGAYVMVLENRLQVRLQGERQPETLGITLSHPLEADRDFSVTLTKRAPGLYLADLPNLLGTNWHWVIVSAEDAWRLDGSLKSDNFMGATPL
ncbi:MAG: FixH family protein [Pseudomonadota bacterium]